MRWRVLEESLITVEGFDGNGRMDVELTIGELVEQLSELERAELAQELHAVKVRALDAGLRRVPASLTPEGNAP